MIALTDRQERTIHRAAGEMVAAAVTRRPVRLTDPALDGAARQTVMGAFVSLKRRGRLRGCCGQFGEPAALADAVGQAARRTALEDLRLPPVSPTELAHLTLEVWLLEGPTPVVSSGAERAAEIVVGRHGLLVRRGSAGGLLLPGVAVENRLDAEAFLEEVCLKANLPPTAWKEDDTALFTFVGHAIAGPFDPEIATAASAEPARLLDAAGAARLADHCRENVVAWIQGRMSVCYNPACPDGNAHGLSMALRLPERPEILRVSRLSLRPGLPLQSTLYGMTEAAAGALTSLGLDKSRLADLRVELCVLWDPAMHGTVMEPDFDGLDSASRALLVLEGDRWAWVYNPSEPPAELVAAASSAGRVRRPAGALVLSLAAESMEAPVVVAEVPRPQPGPRVRPPAVAGAFYPKDAGSLRRLVDDLLGGGESRPEPWPAVLVPHAGLQFSGRVAAAVFRQVRIPDAIIILAPGHTRAGMEWAVAPHETWALPGTAVASDPELARQLGEAIPGLALDAAAHEKEHSIEVQLPLLARLAPSARVVGITLRAATLDECRRFAGGLAEVLRRQTERPLLVISSDLNHYASDAENRRLDALALAALEGLDPAEVHDTMTRHKISMCGLLPAVVVLETLRQLGTLRTFRRVAYATSAEAGGDRARVVGYAGLLFG